MQRVAFTMKLYPGQQEEYKRRHDALWPELRQLLKETGIYDYAIFLDEQSATLFASYKLAAPHSLAELAAHPVMQQWWAYMQDIMETHPSHEPVSMPLKEMFYME